jgi:hypothetical protein
MLSHNIWSLVAVLLANIVVFVCLKPIATLRTFVAHHRLITRVQLFRAAGLLMLLVAVSHAQTPGVVTHDGDWVIAQRLAAQNGLVEYSKGEDGLLVPHKNVMWQFDTGYKPLDNILNLLWNNCGKLLLLAIVIFVMIVLRQHSEISLHGTPRTSKYERAFVVPGGMHSGYDDVPVRVMQDMMMHNTTMSILNMNNQL